MRKVRIGIIGVGNIGTVHMKHIMRGEAGEWELVAAADRSPGQREMVRELAGEGVRLFEAGPDLIDSGVCEAVLIAVPHYQHPELSIQALRKGQHVMCEKPAGVYTKAVAEMNAAAEESDAIFAMMFNQRTNCLYRKMRELVQSGELGEIRRVNWIITDWFRTQFYYDSGAWRATWAGEGGGVLLNQCPHNLDLLQWICGMPSRVRAFCHQGKWHDIEVEDDVTAYLEYPNGATGVFITTTGDAPGTNRFEVTLDGGKLVCEDGKLVLHKNAQRISEYLLEAKDGYSTPECEVIPVETDGENPQHAGVMRAFAGAILRGEPLVARGVEGIRGLALSNAMHLSSWLDRTVDFPIDEDLFLEELDRRRASSRIKTGKSVYSDTEGSYGS